MKAMTCKQLGGACDVVFRAKTFEEMAEMSKNHGTEMYKIQDKAHMEAMGRMQKMMTSPDSMQKWYNTKKAEFDALPID